MVKPFVLLNEASETSANSDEVWLLLSLEQLRADKFDEVISAARRLGEIKGNDAWGLAIEGLAQAGAGHTKEARNAYERALEIDAKHPIALIELAEMYEDEGNQDEAIRLYKSALEDQSLSNSARARLALLLEREDRSDEKTKSILREVANDADALLSQQALVDLLYEKGRQAEGIEVLRYAAKSTETWQASGPITDPFHWLEVKTSRLREMPSGARLSWAQTSPGCTNIMRLLFTRVEKTSRLL